MARDEAYRRAEKKIEEARRSGAKELDLSMPWTDEKTPKLTELPESLGQLTQLQSLNLAGNQLTALPESLGQLTQLQTLDLRNNQLTALPEWLGQLTQLQTLNLSENQLAALPKWLGQLTQLRELTAAAIGLLELPEWIGSFQQLEKLYLYGNPLTRLPPEIGLLRSLKFLFIGKTNVSVLPPEIGRLSSLTTLLVGGGTFGNTYYLGPSEVRKVPEEVGQLHSLELLGLSGSRVKDLPASIANLESLRLIDLENCSLNPELAAAYKEGIEGVKRYLRAKAEAQVVLNEAKLILIGEGEVGKSCLLGALRGDPWEEGRPTTHGIEIKPLKVTDLATGTEITLNGWDFGGQRVYRPTHQLFFSAPAVYLVVWKPREGPQQGFVREWIKLVKHREPDAKILVVATHGGPGQRQPDIDRQEMWDVFGKETVVNFFHVDSQPPNRDEKTGKRTGECRGIKELRDAIAAIAAKLPEMGRTVPKCWQEAREKLKESGAAYLPLADVLKTCRDLKMNEAEGRDFVRISHRLGHLIHYEHDPALREIVVLKPDWLATAVSFVLDDKQTRDNHGLVSFGRLSRLWNDPAKTEEFRYPTKLHPVFLRLMERFDLSYRVAGLPYRERADVTSLVAQLVPDIRPDPVPGWVAKVAQGDGQQVQICRIVEAKNGQSATAEGLFYQLIVRLHKYSLGRVNHKESVHWQRGLVLDDDYNGRALLEHAGNDIRITVRAPYPERFLSVLTSEVKWLVESFWAGLRCEVVVPCVEPCGKQQPGTGVFEVEKLIAFKRQGVTEFPCWVSGCSQLQDIDCLLRNAPAARRASIEELLAEGFADVRTRLDVVRQQLTQHDRGDREFLRKLDRNDQRILSKVDDAFTGLMQAFTDEAREGPRLFSFEPVEPGFFGRPKWISEKFRLTLWCEHSRLPLPILNGKGDKRGVYELTVPRDWFVQAAPILKKIVGTLSLVMPVAASVTKLVLDETTYKGIERQLDLAQKSIDSVYKAGEKAGPWLGKKDDIDVKSGGAIESGGAIRAEAGFLRQLQVWLKEKDPTFGGLVRVQNKRQEFLWVHPQFTSEY